MMNFLKKKQQKIPPIIPFSEFSAGREKRTKPDRKTIRSHAFVSAALWGIFALALFYMLFFSDETMIADVVVSGSQRIDPADIEKIVRADMEGKYAGIFPKRNFFFLPRGAISSDIRDFSPRIRSVAAERIFPRGLLVRMEERPTVIIWQSGGSGFILDEGGVARSHPNIPLESADPTVIMLDDEEGGSTMDGESVVKPGVVAYIPEYMQKFEIRFGKTIAPQVRMLSRFSGEILFHVEGGFDMMVDGNQPADETLGTLQAALDRGIPKSEEERLSRVDLRMANKVYYTVKGEEADTR